MLHPAPNNSTFEIAKDGNHLNFRSVTPSKISQALLAHYNKNPGELSQNRDFSFTYTINPDQDLYIKSNFEGIR